IGDTAPLLATIHENEFLSSTVTFSGRENSHVQMATTTQGYLSTWPIELRALGGRKMSWKYEHLAEGDNNIMLFDSETGEVIATANDNYLTLNKELRHDVVHELVITGTAALFMLMHLMPQDL
ncbi:hypothetical protein R3P38DRAFT_2484086, partial [Favolaschia claudopus]